MPKPKNFAAAHDETDDSAPAFDASKAFANVFGKANLEGLGGLTIVQDDETTVINGALRILPVGLQIQTELSFDQWVSLLAGIQRIKQAYQWMLGDWLQYGVQRRYGETGEQMLQIAQLTGKDTNTLYDYQRTARAFEFLERSKNLPFEIYRIIARRIDGDDESARQARHDWLIHALEQKLSGRKLAALMDGEGVTPLSESSALLDKANKRRFGKVWRMMERGTHDRIKQDDLRLLRAWLDEVEKQLFKK
jgi:hypothetical protein